MHLQINYLPYKKNSVYTQHTVNTMQVGISFKQKFVNTPDREKIFYQQQPL